MSTQEVSNDDSEWFYAPSGDSEVGGFIDFVEGDGKNDPVITVHLFYKDGRTAEVVITGKEARRAAKALNKRIAQSN